MTKERLKEMAKRMYCYEYSGRYCKKCGFDSFDNPWIMDYHHRDPNEKEFELSSCLKRGAFSRIKSEIDKCDLLCSHCHRTLHYEKDILEYKSNIDDILIRIEELKECGGLKKPTRKDLSIIYNREQIEKLIQEGKSIKDMVAVLGGTYRSMTVTLQKFGLRPLKSKKPILTNKESIIRDYINYGFGISTLSEKYSMSEDDMCKTLKSYNIKIRTKKQLFSADDIHEIKTLHQSGVKIQEIAKIVGRHPCSIYSLLKKHNIRETEP
jgi:hypothetical protein